MTIVYESSRASALASSSESNNPFVTAESVFNAETSGTYQTESGTEVLAAENATTESTYDPWTAEADGSGFATWRATFSEARGGTIAAIAVHNIGTLGGSVRIQYSDDSGSNWSDSGAGIVTPEDNAAIAWRFDNQTHVDWRVLVSGVTTGAEVSIGVIYIGSEIIIPRRIYQGTNQPITPTAVDLRSNVSEGAHLLGSAYVVRGSTFQETFKNIPASFIRGSDWKTFQRRWNQGGPAFWGWRPTKYGDLFYSWRQGDAIRPENSGPKDYMSFSISARAYDE